MKASTILQVVAGMLQRGRGCIVTSAVAFRSGRRVVATARKSRSMVFSHWRWSWGNGVRVNVSAVHDTTHRIHAKEMRERRAQPAALRPTEDVAGACFLLCDGRVSSGVSTVCGGINV